MLTEHLKYSFESLSNIESISVGDLLRKELIKKSDFGKKILESNKDYSYIDDQIIIELV
jgi:adenylate kinase family enzyme